MISGYAENGFPKNSLETFKKIRISRVNPNSIIFANILLVYTTMGVIQEDMDINQRVVKIGFSSKVVVVIFVVDMYMRYGKIHNTHELFEVGYVKEGMEFCQRVFETGFSTNVVIMIRHVSKISKNIEGRTNI